MFGVPIEEVKAQDETLDAKLSKLISDVLKDFEWRIERKIGGIEQCYYKNTNNVKRDLQNEIQVGDEGLFNIIKRIEFETN